MSTPKPVLHRHSSAFCFSASTDNLKQFYKEARVIVPQSIRTIKCACFTPETGEPCTDWKPRIRRMSTQRTDAQSAMNFLLSIKCPTPLSDQETDGASD